MGHALNNSLQDVLVRFNRMKGNETLWQPGTDHAGIATQAVVEKNLEKKGIKKHDLGRENSLKKFGNGKKSPGGIILDQLKKLAVLAIGQERDLLWIKIYLKPLLKYL